MRTIAISILAVTTLYAQPAFARQTDAESSITKYCEPLLSGTTASVIGALARKDGFKDDIVGGHPVLRKGQIFVGVSDSPRVCLVQPSSEMTFDQGVAIVDAWARRLPGAIKSPTTKGPDGARVKAWSSPAQKRSLIVTEQTNSLNQKVLNFIMMPLASAVR